MRLKNDTIKSQILDTARREFLENGFQKTSLREIARKANRTTGVIYTYFKNKDDLFETLVSPVKMVFASRLGEPQHPVPQATKDIDLKSWFTQNLRFLLSLAERYPDEMRLLFLCSQGSAFDDYKNVLIREGTRRSLTAFRKFERTESFENRQLSRFFVQNLVQYVFNVVVEILRQEKTSAEIQEYEAEISSFLFSGWKALVKM